MELYTNMWYPPITTNYDFEIGRWTTNDDSREYNGYLDDFRIYNKALTSTEIGYLANKMTKITNNFHKIQSSLNDFTILDIDATNLVAWYKFNDPNNLNYDTISKTNTGTFGTTSGGSYAMSDGIIGNAITFNANNSNPPSSKALYLLNQNSPFSLNNEHWTISFFNKYLGSRSYGRLMQIGNSFIRINGHGGHYINKGAPEEYAFDDSLPGTYPSSISTTSWKHITIVKNYNIIKIYYNASLIITLNVPFSTFTGDGDSITLGDYVLSDNDSQTKKGGFGSFSDFRIYDIALSNIEIQYLARNMIKFVPKSLYIIQEQIYQYTTLDIDSTNLISHYKFDDDFNDSTSYNNNLILSTISPPNLNNSGIVGKALQFQNNIDTDTLTNGIRDGTVKIPTINLVNKEVTISFWIKLLNDFDSFSGIFVFGEQNKIADSGSIKLSCANYSSSNNIDVFYKNNQSDVGTNAAGNLSIGVWYNIVITISSSQLKVYTNNALTATESLIEGLPNNIYDDNYLGTYDDSTYTNTKDDYLLDDFRIYDKILNETEISYLANNMIVNPEYKILTFTYDNTIYPKLGADANNLIAWYKFDGDLNDSSNNDNNLLAVINGQNFQDGKIDKSILFNSDETTQITTIADFPQINQNSIFTVSVWVKLTDTERNFIFAWGDDGSLTSVGLQIENSKINFYIYGGSQIETTNTFTDINKYYHIVLIRNSGFVKIYVDNVLEVEGTTTDNFDTGLSRLYIGHTLNAEHHSTSYLDDFRIYDKALTHDEISVLYNVNQTTYNLLFEQPTECDILIVGGGGGGGAVDAGGGGAGGLIYEKGLTLNGNFIIKIGKGGSGGIGVYNSSGQPGSKGYNSQLEGGNIIINKEAIGGGGGGQGHPTDTEPNPAGGGSSGGLGSGDISRESANIHIDGQGYSGGNGGGTYGGGGGGGAGGPGGNANNNAGVGGVGREIDITGIATYYAGGGGGGFGKVNNSWTNADGGLGGGGRGSAIGNGLDATYYGGGGGGGGANWGSGGNGGSGVVIIRYKVNPSEYVSKYRLEVNQNDSSPYNTSSKIGNWYSALPILITKEVVELV